MKFSGKIQLAELKNLFGRLGKNLAWLFLALFLALLALEVLEVKKSVSLALSSGQQPEIVSHQQGVRIDFNSYQKAIQKIQSAPNFVPDAGSVNNPFGTGH